MDKEEILRLLKKYDNMWIEIKNCFDKEIDKQMRQKMKWISVKDRLPTKEECEKDHGWFFVNCEKTLPKRAYIARYDAHDPVFGMGS